MKDVVGFMDVSLGGGMLKGERVMEFFRRNFVDRPIEELSMPFAAVATALHTGAEVWLRDGSTVEAVRASIAMPGLFTPVLRDGMMLVDGGLVNPVPVSLARAMGADFVIAVDLSSDKLGHRLAADNPAEAPGSPIGEWVRRLQESLGGLVPAHSPGEPRLPPMHDVLLSSAGHHGGADRAQPHGGRPAGCHRGSAAGPPAPARFSPREGGNRGRRARGGGHSAQSAHAWRQAAMSAAADLQTGTLRIGHLAASCFR